MEVDSSQYDTAQSLTPGSLNLREVKFRAVSYCAELVFSTLKYKYLGKNETKTENILTHCSVAQACSNDEKNWGYKILLDCHFKGEANEIEINC